MSGGALVDLVGLRRGHFVFESGAHGDTWLELDALFRRPQRLRPYVAALSRELAVSAPEVVCGPMTGGALCAQLVAAELGCDAVWTERGVADGGGVTYRLPGWTLPVVAGRRVAIVDDAIAAGSAIRGTREALAVTASVVAIAALFTTGSRVSALEFEFGLPILRVAHVEAGLWSAEACPLCRSGGRPGPD